MRALARLRSQQPGPGPRPSRRAPEWSSPALAEPRRSFGSLPARRRRRQRRPRRCCSCGSAAQVPPGPGSPAAASLAPAPAPRGTRAREEATLGPCRLPCSPAGSACLPEPARPLVSRARSHSRLAHGHPPHGPATHTALGAPRRCPRLLRAAPAAPAPSHRVPAPRLSSRVSGRGPSGRCGGQGPRAEERRAPQTGGLEKEAPSLRPADPGALRTRGSAGAGRGARARGGGGPGGSPTRGSCCLNPGAHPSRRLPRPAQPRPPGAPVPCVPGRCSLPRERRDWSARAEPPSPTASAAAPLVAEAHGRGKCVLSTGNEAFGVRGDSPTPREPGLALPPRPSSDCSGAGPATRSQGRPGGEVP